MLEEQTLLPFQATELRGEKLLVLAPHPDDEVIGCGGLVALHAAEKRQIRIVVATDGLAAENSTDDSYRARREDETNKGLASLGAPAAEFLRLKDRALAQSPELETTLERIIVDYAPDLIAVPALTEVHPDHAALGGALVGALQRNAALQGRLAMCRIAFYEVSQPFRPNTLVDVTPVMEAKLAAIRAHESQTSLRDYAHFARGLNAYRAMTLPGEVQYAEAYWVEPATALRLEPLSAIGKRMSPVTRSNAEVQETLPIAVLVRTKNRPEWLREALDSIRANGHPARIVVVNDGGASPREIVGDGVQLIDNAHSAGRSEAMNIAARAAEGASHLAFLDDDDLYYPEHLETLARAAESGTHAGVYSDAVSAFYSLHGNGAYECDQRLRIFAQDFDRDLLLVDNYIPLPTLLVSRADFLDTGGFDRQFDLFEDWDFIIRLARRGPLVRVPRVTCEIRHFAAGQSAVLASPEGSDSFRRAKTAVWQKHRSLMTDDVFANAISKMKLRSETLLSESTEARGRAMHLEKDVVRLTREKQQSDAIALRAHELELAMTSAQETIRNLHETEARLHGDIGELTSTLKIALEENKQLALELERYRIGNEHLVASQSQLQAEVERLNGVLQQIFASRTWQLHTFVQKMKGRS